MKSLPYQAKSFMTVNLRSNEFGVERLDHLKPMEESMISFFGNKNLYQS